MIPTSTSVSIEDGLDFILSHFEEPHFPRRISTHATQGKQILVYNRDEAITKFREAMLFDCRISAYPYPIPESRGVNRQIPNFFVADLDRKNFKTCKSFNQCLESTLQNFKDKLHSANPTVLWTGGGNHLLQPLDADIVLETESVFAEFAEPSRKLMQYAEKLLTDNKCDPCHCNTVSFNNCMIRIPVSYNSKYVEFDNGEVVNIPPKSEVSIVLRRDSYKPNIRWLLRGLWDYLIQERNNEALSRLHDEQKRLRFESKYPNRCRQQTSGKIDWIESLYTKPLDDFRKYCIWRVFAPYFINVKGLSRLETFSKISSWLNRCNSVSRLGFDPTQKINYELDHVANYRPIRQHQLKDGNPELYTLLEKEGVLS